MFILEHVVYKDVLRIERMHIEPQKITCIVGESGGGKTTLLRLLAKLSSPDSGTIVYEGKPLEDYDSITHRKDVVLLSQKPHIFPSTVKDNLIVGLNLHGKSYDDETLKQSLAVVKLNKKLDQSIENFSVGEAQRLALARIMLLDARVVLLDEPSSALDENTERLVIEAVVSYVREHKKTLVMVTHSKTVAKQYADTIYTIEKGTIKERALNDH